MDKVLEKLEAALIAAQFNDVMISDDREAVFFTDDEGTQWAITPEQF